MCVGGGGGGFLAAVCAIIVQAMDAMYNAHLTWIRMRLYGIMLTV